MWGVRFRVIDIETTGLAPPAEIIEIGRVDVVIVGGSILIEQPRSRLYRPLNGIPPETMAVHHITEADLPADAPVCTDELMISAVRGNPAPDALVAHNCAFEQQFIPGHITDRVPWICTHKIALRIWPDAPRHSNQVLRYWRRLTLDAALAMPPHRAGPDAWVTAHLFAEMAQVPISEMMEWTLKPKQLPIITFGKHRGSQWPEIPADYLHWMTRQKDMDLDAVHCANEELARRARP
jgi:exodeoxyribonuclease X